MSSPLLSAHIGYLYSELGLLDRVRAAARAGFTAIEHPNPLSVDAGVMLAQMRQHGLAFSQMGAAAGDAARGEKGLAAVAGREAEFRDAVRRALDYAETIGCPLVHPMAGIADGDRQRAEETYRANLAFAVEQCRGRPVNILLEAISDKVVAGYFMSSLDQAIAFADEVGFGREIVLLVDTFHAAVNGTDLDAFIAAHAARIGHVHIADAPGRHEPGTGSLDFTAILKALLAQGYNRAIGFEYIPSRPTDETLSWMPAWRDLLSGAAAR
jgi:2-dehydrotetronate isomerase